LIKIVFITFNVLKQLICHYASRVETWVTDFATQHLSELILTWECVLCSCNDFHAECS